MKVFVATLLLVASVSAMKRPAAAGEDVVELFKRAAAPVAGLRVKRDACQAAAQTYATCVQEAMMDGQKQLQSGGDGREDFIPRKVCNSFDAMLNCGDAYRTACNLPEDTFKELMKTGLEPAMDAFSQVPGWNGDKCPAFRHIKYGEARTSGASTNVLNILVLSLLPVLGLRL